MYLCHFGITMHIGNTQYFLIHYALYADNPIQILSQLDKMYSVNFFFFHSFILFEFLSLGGCNSLHLLPITISPKGNISLNLSWTYISSTNHFHSNLEIDLQRAWQIPFKLRSICTFMVTYSLTFCKLKLPPVISTCKCVFCFVFKLRTNFSLHMFPFANMTWSK